MEATGRPATQVLTLYALLALASTLVYIAPHTLLAYTALIAPLALAYALLGVKSIVEAASLTASLAGFALGYPLLALHLAVLYRRFGVSAVILAAVSTAAQLLDPIRAYLVTLYSVATLKLEVERRRLVLSCLSALLLAPGAEAYLAASIVVASAYAVMSMKLDEGWALATIPMLSLALSTVYIEALVPACLAASLAPLAWRRPESLLAASISCITVGLAMINPRFSILAVAAYTPLAGLPWRRLQG